MLDKSMLYNKLFVPVYNQQIYHSEKENIKLFQT